LIISSQSFDGTRDISSHICIVGAGAAGISLACELDGIGVPVVLLEASGTGLLGRVSQDPYAGTATGGHLPPSDFRRRAFGGSTTIWGGRCVPYDPIDFERREYAENSGWPITYEEVAQYYPKAMDYCDAGLLEFSVTGSLEDQAPTIPGLDPSADVEANLIERYSLPTNFGARNRKKLEQSDNVRVITFAQALRAKKSPLGDRIATIEFATRSGKNAQVSAQLFVLALGGIETTRFLFASDLEGAGLGNQSDCLGRYYTCHLENILGVVRSKEPGVVFDFQTTRDGVYARRKLRIRDRAQRREGILNTTFRLHFPNVADPEHRSSILSAVYLAKRTIIPEYRRILQHGKNDPASSQLLAKHVRNVVTGMPGLLGFSIDWTRRRVLAKRKLPYILVPNANGTFPLEFNAEQTPLRESRITLIGDKDAYGIPRVNIDWRCCEADLESICKAYRLLKRQIDASGRCELELDDEELQESVAQSFPVSGHHIGTTRMADGPSDGVVDVNCAVYGVPNLFVAGPSVFPTSSHANPVLTIVALSLRLAAHLKGLVRT
jgi:choline dehydrogenase-like flavoprotein